MDIEDTVRALAKPLLRYCLARTGRLVVAEDLAQEALTALVSRWRRFGPPESPQAFVFSIARRRARRANLRQRLLEPLERLAGRADPAPSPEETADLRRQLAALELALAELSAAEREALLLVVGGELKQTEAAAVLGISISAMKMRLLRARNHLHEILELGYESSA